MVSCMAALSGGAWLSRAEGGTGEQPGSRARRCSELGRQRGPLPLREQTALPGQRERGQQPAASPPAAGMAGGSRLPGHPAPPSSRGLPEGRARQLRVSVCGRHVTHGDTAGQCRLGTEAAGQLGWGRFLGDWVPRPAGRAGVCSWDEGQAVLGASWERRAEQEPRKAKDMSESLNGSVTTHVLNTVTGLPAAGLALRLAQLQGPQWTELTERVTDNDGRCLPLLAPGQAKASTYKLRFETAAYWQGLGHTSFYPYVEVVFTIVDPAQKLHVPLLISPYSYTTYRGS
ncbi:uncharacterized protein [Struthio camelus]